jgi:oligopeptide transport system permease protein
MIFRSDTFLFFGKKLLSLFITLFFVVSLTFCLMKAIPGDPFTDEKALPEKIHAALRKHYGLDDPWLEQYVKYVWSAFTWDLGPSLKYQDRTVHSIIKKSFPVSAILGLEALLIALSVGISLGVISALKQNRWQDRLFMLTASIGISVPSFILAVLLQYLLAIQWGLFPVARWGSFAQSILPALSLAAMPTAYIARLVRSNMIEVLKSDYIKTAQSKGLTTSRIVFAHALKNTLSPLAPYFAQLTANILLGSFVVEKIFGIPGLGQWFVNSINNRDYTVILGTTLFYSFILLSLLFVADIIQGLLDPRIKRLS